LFALAVYPLPASFLAPCFKPFLTKMPGQKETCAKSASHTEYMRQRRQAMSEDQKKQKVLPG